MKNRKLIIIVVIAILGSLSGVGSAYNVEGEGICNCNTCDDCELALNDNTDCTVLVNLTTDITDHSGTCINNPVNFSNKIFDCQGHTIDGDDTADSHGIGTVSKDGNTIKNCIITDFDIGIYLGHDSDNNVIQNNNITSCTLAGSYIGSSTSSADTNQIILNNFSDNVYGFYIRNGAGNVLSNNTFCDNSNTDIYDVDGGDSGDNNTCDSATNYNDLGNTTCSFDCPVGVVNCSCSTCDDCEADLNSAGCSVVNLTADIVGEVGATCIGITGRSDKIFDGGGHWINGTTTSVSGPCAVGYGIYFQDGENVTIQNVKVSKFANGIFTYGCDYMTVNRCTVTQIPCDCVAADGATQHLTITNSILTHADNNHTTGAGSAIYMHTGTAHVTINNVTAGYSIYNIAGYYADYVNITNSNLDYTDNTWVDYGGIGLSSGCDHWRIVNNTISNTQGEGIKFYNTPKSDILIENNTICNNDREGIITLSGSTGIVINNNRICNNTDGDIVADGGSSGDNNTCDTTSNWNDTGTTRCTYACSLTLNFTDPTPANETAQFQNWTEINISINGSIYALDTFKFNWNTINYTIYDDSLVLGMNFNNNPATGDTTTNVSDFSIYNNFGTKKGVGEPAWNTSGKYGSALTFDGVDDYVDCGNDSSLNIVDDITIEMWIYPRSTLTWQQILGKGQAPLPKDVNYDIWQTSTNKIRFSWGGDGVSSDSLDSAIITMNQWHHIVATLANGNFTTIYLDGQLSTSKTTFIAAVAVTQNLDIGGFTSWYFNGTIDEVCIYNRALTPDEVLMHYYSNLQKYDTAKWSWYSNISNLSEGAYTYYGWANDTSGDVDSTETRTLTISSCSCINCTDCTAKLNNVLCTSVNLTANILNHVGTCINSPVNFTNKIFDCENYLIEGDNTGSDYGIYLDGKNSNIINKCNISKFNRGIMILNSFNNSILNSNLSFNLDEGIYLFSSYDNVLINNTISFHNDSGDSGIRLDFSENNNVLNNNVTKNYYGVYLSSSSFYNNFTTNMIDNNFDGVNILSGCSNNNFVNNLIYNNSNIGFYSSSSNISIINNNVSLNNGGGLYLTESNYNNISENSITSNGENGIWLKGNNNNLTYNNVNYNAWSGIYLHVASTNNSFYFNIVCNNSFLIDFYYDINNNGINNSGYENSCLTSQNWSDLGVFKNCEYLCDLMSCKCVSCPDCEEKLNNIQCRKVILINNINFSNEICINGNDLPYFREKIFDCDNYEISANTSNLSRIGIYLYYNYENHISNCRISNFVNGIKLRYSDNNIIDKCYLYNNSIGIYVSKSDNLHILNSSISNNSGDGIFVCDSNYLLVSNCLVYENDGIGIDFISSDSSIISGNKIIRNNGGVYMFSETMNMKLNQNILCRNVEKDPTKSDVFSRGTNNKGTDNCCNFVFNWDDMGTGGECHTGCYGVFSSTYTSAVLNRTDIFIIVTNFSESFGFRSDFSKTLFVIIIKVIIDIVFAVKGVNWIVVLILNLFILLSFTVIGWIPFSIALLIIVIVAFVFGIILKKSTT